MKRHERLTEEVRQQTEARYEAQLAYFTKVRKRQGRDLTEEDRYLCAIHACANRAERRRMQNRRIGGRRG